MLPANILIASLFILLGWLSMQFPLQMTRFVNVPRAYKTPEFTHYQGKLFIRVGVTMLVSVLVCCQFFPDLLDYTIFFFLSILVFSLYSNPHIKGAFFHKIGLLIVGVALISFIPLTYFVFNADTDAVLLDKQLKIAGVYGLTVDLNEIDSIGLENQLPAIQYRWNGLTTKKVLKGNFVLQNGEKAKLFLHRVIPCIYIRTSTKIVYVNFNEQEKTVELFNKLKSGLQDISTTNIR